MKNFEISVSDIEQLPEVAKTILQFSKGRKVFAFYAEMGTGKTTLIKELCRQLGSHDNFSSPTYSIVNEYLISPLTTNHSPFAISKIYHIDLYRIKNIQEAIEIGIEDYISGNSYCFIEWPELIEHLLPHDAVKISIKSDGNIRNVSIFIN